MRYFGRDTMIELDHALIEDYGIDLTIMMENAGRSLALLAKRIVGHPLSRKGLVVLAGRGNNGGGGLVAARHLHNWGASPDVILSHDVSELKEAPAKQLEILKKIGVNLKSLPQTRLENYDLIIDALLGYNLGGPPQEPIAQIIRAANLSKRPILSLDVPSGLDATSGEVYDPCIRAYATLSLGMPKLGLKVSRKKVGKLYLADISIPRREYDSLGIIEDLFSQSPIIRLKT